MPAAPQRIDKRGIATGAPVAVTSASGILTESAYKYMNIKANVQSTSIIYWGIILSDTLSVINFNLYGICIRSVKFAIISSNDVIKPPKAQVAGAKPNPSMWKLGDHTNGSFYW